jgi:A/G-specific adenine glycosylase
VIDAPAPILPAIDAVPEALHDAILAWYEINGRDLPFRRTTDPYAILVSEAMAQQTQADRAGQTWTLFMARFPTVETLAAATPADVLRAWRGLGYNRRALNLWRAARRVVEAFDGQVPADLDALESLPGVGPYTARAVAALAFGMPVGAVDTNVRRVLGRIVAGEVGEPSAADLQVVADAAVPVDSAGAWTHALMDIGATICRAGRPSCEACPAQPWCRLAGAVVAAGAAGPASAAGVPGWQAATSTRVVARKRRSATREAAAPFHSTSRWLRGRIIDRLRLAPDGEWVPFDDPMGAHDTSAVAAAVNALASEGLLELDSSPPGGLRARLPLA